MTRRGYAICQLAGWSAWSLTSLMYLQLSGAGISWRSLQWTVVDSAFGFTISHVYRSIVRTRRWYLLPLRSLAPRVLLASIIQAAILDALIFAWSLVSRGSADQPIPPDLIVMFWFNFSIVYLAWSFLYFGLHWLERSRRAEQAELRYLKSQLNPHFLFNALNGIRGLVAEDPPKAQEAITRLAKLLRVALGSATADTVPLARELEVVDDYLAVEAVRLDDRLAVTLDISPEALDVAVPAMLVQTLVENAIKHGIARRTDGGTLVVSARCTPDTLELCVSNPAADGTAETIGGTGLANAQERLQLLFGRRASLELDRSDASVTVARVRIPITSGGAR